MDTLKAIVCWLGELVWHVAPALTAVALGGFLVNRFFVRKANLAVLVERVCDALNDLMSDAAAYWSVDAATKREFEHAILEAKIKGHTLMVSALVAIIQEKYRKLPTDESKRVMDLMDAATGGDFETRNRKADKVRYGRISRCAGRLMAALQRLKV